MVGNRGRVGMVLQPRDEQLLRALRHLRVVDREQAQRVMGFSAIRRTNARLLKLTHAHHLKRSFIGHAGCGRRALYQLPHDRARTSPAFLEHQLRVNELYLVLRDSIAPAPTLADFRTFKQPVASGLALIPDAYAELVQGGLILPYFVEVDRGTESGRIWRKKARLYLSLASSGGFERTFGHLRFRVVVLSTTPRRLEYIRRAVSPVTQKLFWFSAFEILNGASFFGPVWLRPHGAEKVPLM